jgi:hypothetical protein
MEGKKKKKLESYQLDDMENLCWAHYASAKVNKNLMESFKLLRLRSNTKSKYIMSCMINISSYIAVLYNTKQYYQYSLLKGQQ